MHNGVISNNSLSPELNLLCKLKIESLINTSLNIDKKKKNKFMKECSEKFKNLYFQLVQNDSLRNIC